MSEFRYPSELSRVIEKNDSALQKALKKYYQSLDVIYNLMGKMGEPLLADFRHSDEFSGFCVEKDKQITLSTLRESFKEYLIHKRGDDVSKDHQLIKKAIEDANKIYSKLSEQIEKICKSSNEEKKERAEGLHELVKHANKEINNFNDEKGLLVELVPTVLTNHHYFEHFEKIINIYHMLGQEKNLKNIVMQLLEHHDENEFDEIYNVLRNTKQKDLAETLLDELISSINKINDYMQKNPSMPEVKFDNAKMKELISSILKGIDLKYTGNSIQKEVEAFRPKFMDYLKGNNVSKKFEDVYSYAALYQRIEDILNPSVSGNYTLDDLAVREFGKLNTEKFPENTAFEMVVSPGDVNAIKEKMKGIDTEREKVQFVNELKKQYQSGLEEWKSKCIREFDRCGVPVNMAKIVLDIHKELSNHKPDEILQYEKNSALKDKIDKNWPKYKCSKRKTWHNALPLRAKSRKQMFRDEKKPIRTPLTTRRR